MKVTFLLAKDPACEHTGDMAMARLVMDLAAASYDVTAICFSPQPDRDGDGFRRVVKPPPRWAPLLRRSIAGRRSLVHTRFATPAFTAAVDEADTDVFAADHSYMAEPYLASRHARGASATPLAVSTVVPEAMVWTATRGVVGRLDARRIRRDEMRVAHRAYSVGTYDRDEARGYADAGIVRSHYLDMTLPPGERIDVAATPPRLVFVGDRRWAPNQEAFAAIAALWPRIAEGLPGAELAVVGAPDPAAPPVTLPPGMTDVGFVDDLAAYLATCRALVAPIRTGGGVRVKILEAATRGMPVVGTSAAVGSLGEALGIDRLDDEEHFVARCRRYLRDAGAAAAAGDDLYARNAGRWADGVPAASVERWLRR